MNLFMKAMALKTLKEAAVILVVALVLAAGAYALRPSALPLIRQETGPAPQAADNALFAPISIERAEDLFKQGRAVFADARPRSAFEQHHIAGALHLDPQEMDRWSDPLMTRYPPEQIIITYCDGPDCDLSRILAEKITWLGFEEVYDLNNGWTQWRKRGLPVEP